MSEEERLQELIAAVSAGTKSSPPNFFRAIERTSKATEALVNKENSEILEMRQKWANWILVLIVVIAVFDMVLVTFYGLGIWNFNNPTVVIAVITENFLKIVGLGFLITGNLFKKIFR